MLLFRSVLNVVQLFTMLMFVNVVEQCSGQILLGRAARGYWDINGLICPPIFNKLRSVTGQSVVSVILR